MSKLPAYTGISLSVVVMMKFIKILIIVLSITSCNSQSPIQFSQEALSDTFISLEGESIQFQDILNKHKEQTILIDVWASWCRDCIKGMPKVKEIQAEYPDVVYLFLSLDKNINSWKKGIDKHQVKGEHYYMQSGWKGPFGDFLDLDWIPRYLVVDKQGNIKLYKAVKASDKNIIKSLK